MKIAIIQHIDFEKPGLILDWINLHQHSYKIFRADLSELPSASDFDLYIILGGFMSVNDKFDWITSEIELVKKIITGQKLVFGICLGAQLIAKALEAEVYKNKHKEIGWFPIHCVDNFLEEDITVLHWHGETFDLPNDAHLLATSKACTNQAFSFQDNVLAIQFHLEMNNENLKLMISNCGDELIQSEFVQCQEDIINGEQYIENCKNILFDLLDGFELSLK